MSGFNQNKWNTQDRSRYAYAAKYAGSGGGFADNWQFIRPRDLPDGVATLRLLPAMEGKCQDGFRKLAYHIIPMVEGAPDKEQPRVHCARLSEDGECFVCELLEACADVRQTFPEHLKTVFEDRKYLRGERIVMLPATLNCHHDPHAKPPADWRSDPKNFKGPVIPTADGSRKLTILMIETKALEDRLGELWSQNPNLNSKFAGRDLLLTRNGKTYSLQPAMYDSPLSEAEQAFLDPKVYPAIDKMYKKVMTLPYAQQYERVMRAWWRPELESLIGELSLGAETDMAPPHTALEDIEIPF